MKQTDPDRLPLSASSFENIIRRGQIYVDKTELICRLASTHRKYFISRPRRFGKTLLLSAFESLFRHGTRDFAGLALEDLWEEQRTYTVLRLDFSQVEQFRDGGEFLAKLGRMLDRQIRRSGLMPPENGGATHDALGQLDAILGRSEADSLVLLIDEYDAPLNHCLGRGALFDEVLGILHDFYIAIKANEQALRFMFFTGIIRYRHVGLFSGFNIYQDLSMDPRYATLLGYTSAEISRYFMPYVEQAAAVPQLSCGECLEQLRLHYDGFCFDQRASGSVYAPWSVLSFLSAPELGFENYWYESAGTPTLLVRCFRERLLEGELILNADQHLHLDELNAVQEVRRLSPLALLTQAGYFTIKEVDAASGWVTVNYPNRELAASIRRLYAQVLQGLGGGEQAVTDIRRVFEQEEPERIVAWLNDTLFLRADAMRCPFTCENTVRTTVQMCLAAAGLEPAIECRNAHGCSDLEVAAGRRYFVFEFKFCRSSGRSATGGSGGERLGGEAREEARAQALLEEAVTQLRRRRCGEQNRPDLEHVQVAAVFSQSRRCLSHVRVMRAGMAAAAPAPDGP